MKVTATNTKVKTVPFVPFTMTLNVETIEELMELYHRMNNNQLPESYKHSIKCKRHSPLGIWVHNDEPHSFQSGASQSIFEVLAEKVKEYPQLKILG